MLANPTKKALMAFLNAITKFYRLERGKMVLFCAVLVSAGSITLENRKYTCPTKNETFECEAAKRVPIGLNRGTSYKIKDLKDPSDERELGIYCDKKRCIVKKNKLYGGVQVLEKNATRLTFKILKLNESLRFSCDVHTAPEYTSVEIHSSDITTVECVRSCIGKKAYLSCQSFRQFLQTPNGLGVFLKKLDGSDITFCNDEGNCTCMEECGEYKGRLEPGYKSVNMRNIRMEDSGEDFMFYFEHKDPGKQTPRKCIFKIDPMVCSGSPPGTPEVTGRSPEENKSIEKAHTDTPDTTVGALEVDTGRSLHENASNVTKQPPTILPDVTSGTSTITKTLLFLCMVLVIFIFLG